MNVPIRCFVAALLLAAVQLVRAQAPSGKPGYTLKENIWDKGVFEIWTIPTAKDETATWLYFDPKTRRGIPSPPTNAEEVLVLYDKQTDQMRAKGIFVYSPYFAVKHFDYTSFQFMLSKDKHWLNSEATLIDELRQACEKRGLALYVNTSGNHKDPWCVLVSPKK
jgi:hypothetical protein